MCQTNVCDLFVTAVRLQQTLPVLGLSIIISPKGVGVLKYADAEEHVVKFL